MLFCLCGTLRASQSNITEIFLPPWYSKASTQTFQLELKDLAADQIALDHPCSISIVQQSVAVTNGMAKVTLSIDLRTTPTTFPIIILAVDEKGRCIECRKLNCHLSLVPTPVRIAIHGTDFILSNLTDRPFDIDGFDNLAIFFQDDRQVRGTLKGKAWIHFKTQGRIQLNPNERKEFP
jgi:hypothetical protein